MFKFFKKNKEETLADAAKRQENQSATPQVQEPMSEYKITVTTRGDKPINFIKIVRELNPEAIGLLEAKKLADLESDLVVKTTPSQIGSLNQELSKTGFECEITQL